MSCDTNSVCGLIATGSVGESGASSLLSHTVEANIPQMIVLRTSESSLCPNTGAVAMLVINGEPVASGNITAVDSSISFEAQPQDSVVAIIHTVPLLNEVMCIRLGDLNVSLNECDLV